MQTTGNILLIRPSGFTFNSETAVSNVFQREAGKEPQESVLKKAREEFDRLSARLQEKGINIFVFEDTPLPQKPDALFPNNWVSFHPDGTVILYPLLAPNR